MAARPGPRRLLQAVALGLMAIAGTASASAVNLPTDPGPGGTAPVRPFRLDQIRLGDGLLQEKRDRIKDFLRDYDERRFLVLFNNQAGRPNTDGITVPGGWEDGGLLSGHWAGHYMTALSQAYADQGEQVFKTKLDWMVQELAACQKAITARMGSGSDGQQPGNNATVGRVAGKFGNALQLNHGDQGQQYVTLPQETINQLRDFTVATWVKLAANQTWTRLFDFGRDTTVNMFLTPRADQPGFAPRFAITTGGSGEEQQINGNTALPVNEWVHIAVTLKGNTGVMYVNGQVAGTNMGMALNPTSLGNPGNRWIGRSQYSGDAPLSATIDEFHIFSRALSAAEVRSLLASAAGTTGGGNIAWYRFDEDRGSTLLDSSANGRDAGIVSGRGGSGPSAWVPTHPGYMGALPEDTVLRLGPPRWAVYGGDAATNTWAPWYTQHKIMRGLLDAYYNTNNSQALDVVVKMANWAHLALTVGDKNQPGYTGNLTRNDLNRMWDLYIAGEFGGANEVFPEIYELTGDARHLETAKAFDNRASLFDAAVQDRDILVLTRDKNPGPRRTDRLHANTHVPQFIGYLRIFEHSGEQDYLDAARNFYGWVFPYRQFASGGTGGNYPGSNNNAEMFQNRGNVANAMADNGAETCTTYNMLKLARNLFMHEHNATYMDGYERGLFNMIAGSRADTAATTGDPQLTYFQPLTPGASRDYGNTGTCCGGSGLESHTKYQETVYLRSADGSALWVNLYVPSTLTWADKGFSLKQETAFPRGDKTKLTVVAAGRDPLDIKLRVPAWAQSGSVKATVNGETDAQAQNPVPGTYLTLSRAWRAGDTIEMHMPFRVRVERAPDRSDTQALMWGPVVLQLIGRPPTGSGGNSGYWELSLYRHLKLDGDYARAAVVPRGSSRGDTLFNVAVAAATGGGQNQTGISSPGTDGPTFLDVLWDRAPFGGHAAFVAAVREVAAQFVAAGVYTAKERDAIVTKAGEAEAELAV
ncbi:acetyl-CoA carboxylase [Magnaporthiopsis poae ATCC 64411]|uniref:Acetyl-CoA carboxylase n=1 Tax=Magnaporthiopsis poae (strain ATCC 64411 / 73-15) TaxID=644358 RepID=A0A0C4DXK3_MAGP6|nr:acetyl-CoA carboxylase [Magnaporthiopsis poae ATCC 64411]